MKARVDKHLSDISHAARAILRFVGTATFAEYQQSELLQSAVERQFVTIGEAANRLKRDRPD